MDMICSLSSFYVASLWSFKISIHHYVNIGKFSLFFPSCCFCCIIANCKANARNNHEKRVRHMSTHIIPVQSSVSTVTKFLETRNMTDVDVMSVLSLMSQNASLSIPNDIDGLSEIENKDVCFVMCDTQSQRDDVVSVLDNYGFDMPPFTISFPKDAMDMEENADLEDVIEFIEERHATFNTSRMMDFMSRVSTTPVFDTRININPEEDEEEEENASDDELITILDINDAQIFPHMLPDNASTYSVFFIAASEYIDEDFEMDLMSTAHRITVDEIAPVDEHKEAIEVTKTPQGQQLVVSNAIVFSAIEGIIPGYVVVIFSAGETANNKDVINAAVWKISHDWVRGLSPEVAYDELGNFFNDIISESFDDNDTLAIMHTEDIPTPQFPFLSDSKIDNSRAVALNVAISSALAEDDKEE